MICGLLHLFSLSFTLKLKFISIVSILQALAHHKALHKLLPLPVSLFSYSLFHLPNSHSSLQHEFVTVSWKKPSPSRDQLCVHPKCSHGSLFLPTVVLIRVDRTGYIICQGPIQNENQRALVQSY